ncbi:MAG: hypothetical protein K6F03_01395 [Saccharofermentans sp.]|jgi:hypothetical protein|nr:hypothetical protein [Saccharofermentans sp.]
MMMSPDMYIELIKDKKYAELLPIRDGLIQALREFEEETYDPAQATMHPTPDVKYQVRLQYLSKLCELICDKFNEEFEQW